ncbi:hypothetical protein CHARACLAT_033103 [Characodon lateralis]|uniref:Uncharacterized protein n=1 Tax=Characodon lateralis TaxID=208331 RepID=A0ABU7E5J3_9TELE|nr:hypothetical protein [Characodon lateralis]
MLKRRVNHDSLIQRLEVLRVDLIHPPSPATMKLFDHLCDFCLGDFRVNPRVPILCFHQGMRDGRIEEILEVLLQPPDNVPSLHSVGEALLPPTEAQDSLPESLRGQLVVLLHGLTELLPGPSFCLCYSPSGGTLGLTVPVSRLRSPKSQPQPIGLLLQLDSIPYCRCPPPGSGMLPRHALQTLRPQLWAAVLTTDGENMVHSSSMSPTSPGIWSKLSRRWELNTSLAEGSTRHFQQTLNIRLGLPSLSGFHLFQQIQLTTIW